jgi:hypothetical protein
MIFYLLSLKRKQHKTFTVFFSIMKKIYIFKPVQIDEGSEIVPIEYENTENIWKEKIFVFWKADNSYFVGTLPEIAKDLFWLLKDNNFNPVARGVIADALNLHWLKPNLIKKEILYFKEVGLNCTPKEKEIREDYPTLIFDKEQIAKQIDKVTRTYNMLQEQWIEISWTDLFYIGGNEVIVGDIKTNVDILLNEDWSEQHQGLILAIKNSL